MASVEGASYPSAHKGKRVVLILGVLGTEPAYVVMFGGAAVSTNTAKIAVAVGTSVMIFIVHFRGSVILMICLATL